MDQQQSLQDHQWDKISPNDKTEASELNGWLVIVWDEVADQSIPISGFGHYYSSGKLRSPYSEVWFLLTGLKRVTEPGKGYHYQTDQAKYLLYALSSESRRDAISEHQRFINEVGYIKDYGDKYRPLDTNKPVKYQRSGILGKLRVKLIGSISYSQVVNKNPTMSVPDSFS